MVPVARLPRRSRTALVVASVGVFAGALLLRLFPIESESLHWDSVSYVRAARHGLLANWIDQGHPGIQNFGKICDFKIPYDRTVILPGEDVVWMRHYHPPVLAYILNLQGRLIGFSNFRVRLYSILCGALNCALLVLVVASLRGKGALGVASGAAAGLLLAVAPYHLFASRTASYHALFPLVVSCYLFSLGRALETGRNGWLGATLGLLALAFATFEWAILLPLVLVIGLLAYPNPWVRFSRATGLMINVTALLLTLGGMALFGVIWPAGVIKADVVENLVYHGLYSKAWGGWGHWWHFYTGYYKASPVLALLEAAGLLYVLGRAAARRVRAGTAVWVIFGVAFALCSYFQVIVYVHYIAPLFPVFALFAGLMVHDLARLAQRGLGFLAPAGAVVIAAVTGFQTWNHPFADPHEVPGFSQAAGFFRDTADPEGSILSTAAPLLRFYLTGYDVRDLPYGPTPPERLEQIKQHRFRYVLIYKDQTDRLEGYREDPGYEYLVQNLSLATTIRHLRRGFECVWIYEDTLYRRPDRVVIEPSLFRLMKERAATDLWHVPLAELPFEEEDLVQLYLDGELMRNGGGYPYRGWDEHCYWPHIYKPEIGLVVGVPHGQGPAWFEHRRYGAAVWHAHDAGGVGG
jgi:hypothetical protein